MSLQMHKTLPPFKCTNNIHNIFTTIPWISLLPDTNVHCIIGFHLWNNKVYFLCWNLSNFARCRISSFDDAWTVWKSQDIKPEKYYSFLKTSCMSPLVHPLLHLFYKTIIFLTVVPRNGTHMLRKASGVVTHPVAIHEKSPTSPTASTTPT